MNVFVTGASGWIGSAVVPELLEAGHQVVGLARWKIRPSGSRSWAPTSSEAMLTIRTSWPRRRPTSRCRPPGLPARGGVRPATFPPPPQPTGRVVEAMGTALAGSDRPFVLASGHARVGGREGGHGERRARPRRGRSCEPRRVAGSDRAVRPLAPGHGVRSSVVRFFPPTVHGDGDQRVRGHLRGHRPAERRLRVTSATATNRWPAVPSAPTDPRLVRLAVEAAPAGSVLHTVGDEGVPFRDIAEAIGRHLDVPDRQQ